MGTSIEGEVTMTTLREAAEQALEALMYCEPSCEENPVGFEKWADVMPILRAALEQIDREPI